MNKRNILQLRDLQSALSAVRTSWENFRDELQEEFDNMEPDFEDTPEGQEARTDLLELEEIQLSLENVEAEVDAFVLRVAPTQE
jgi:hypothetical protein